MKKVNVRRKTGGFTELLKLIAYLVGMWLYAMLVLCLLLIGLLMVMAPWFMGEPSPQEDGVISLIGAGMVAVGFGLGRLYNKNPLKILVDGAMPTM